MVHQILGFSLNVGKFTSGPTHPLTSLGVCLSWGFEPSLWCAHAGVFLDTEKLEDTELNIVITPQVHWSPRLSLWLMQLCNIRTRSLAFTCLVISVMATK